MRTQRAWWALVLTVSLAATACEVPATSAPAHDDPAPGQPADVDAGGRDDEAAPLPVPTHAPAQPDSVGIERVVAPEPDATILPSVPGSTPGSTLRLVAVIPGNGTGFALDGAFVTAEFDARLEVDVSEPIESVEWAIDGELFRDDDLKAPYTLRYAAAGFPLDEWVPSDQRLPSRFRMVPGTSVELSATVHMGSESEEVIAVFTIGAESSATSPTTTSPTTTAPTTTAPTTTAPTTTAPAPTTTTSPPAPPAASSGALWSIPGGAPVSITLPQGHLGMRTATAVDPATVAGISRSGGVWTMARDWDETNDGGYLDFGASALRTDGHRVLGFRIELPANVAGGHLIQGGGEVGWFEISNPHQYSHNSFLRHSMHAHHYVARGVVGDAIKVGQGSAYHHDAYIEMDVRPGGPSDKHYDGAQVFHTGTLRMERVVVEWADAGVTANTTGALFTQDSGALTARDFLVLNPGGTYQPVRLSGTGPHDVDRIQVIGVQRPNNNKPSNMAPTAAVKITNGSGTFSLWNDVAGANDWLIG